MKRKTIIHFKNEPFMALVPEQGDQPIKCTPVVYDAEYNCGVGIFYENGKGQTWGLVCPRNLIAAWRGTEVLRLLKVIEHGTLHDAYHVGLRNPNESDFERVIKPTIELIGKETHDRIMSMPVPETIIRAILDNQGDESKPDLYPITEEVRAGTIEWRQEFTDAGIRHPNEIDAEKKAQEDIIAKHEELLASYASAANLPRDCMGMGNVEGALLTIVEKGADKVHPAHVVVALAATVGSLATAELAMSMFPVGPRTVDEADRFMDEQKDQALTNTANWLSVVTRGSRFSWKGLFGGNKDTLSFDNAKQLLDKLLTEYFPRKSSEAA